MSNWIRNKGDGVMPVKKGTLIEVRYLGGPIIVCKAGDPFSNDWFLREGKPVRGDILEYRILPKSPNYVVLSREEHELIGGEVEISDWKVNYCGTEELLQEYLQNIALQIEQENSPNIFCRITEDQRGLVVFYDRFIIRYQIVFVAF